MSIYDIIQRDHRAVEMLFKDLKKGKDPDECYGIFEELETELLAHAKAEEKVFYSRLRKEMRGEIEESKEEHDGLELIIMQLQDCEPTDRQFMEKINQLERMVNDHVRREEQEIFPLARKVLGDDKNNEIGERMEQEKQRLLDKGLEAVT